MDAIQDQGWCHLIPSLLSLPDHDYREKVLGVMRVLLEQCAGHFLDSARTLHTLRDEYEGLAREEAAEGEGEGDVYFGNLFRSVSEVLEGVLKKEEL